jgi:hypothetical protein
LKCCIPRVCRRVSEPRSAFRSWAPMFRSRAPAFSNRAPHSTAKPCSNWPRRALVLCSRALTFLSQARWLRNRALMFRSCAFCRQALRPAAGPSASRPSCSPAAPGWAQPNVLQPGPRVPQPGLPFLQPGLPSRSDAVPPCSVAGPSCSAVGPPPGSHFQKPDHVLRIWPRRRTPVFGSQPPCSTAAPPCSTATPPCSAALPPWSVLRRMRSAHALAPRVGVLALRAMVCPCSVFGRPCSALGPPCSALVWKLGACMEHGAPNTRNTVAQALGARELPGAHAPRAEHGRSSTDHEAICSILGHQFSALGSKCCLPARNTWRAGAWERHPRSVLGRLCSTLGPCSVQGHGRRTAEHGRPSTEHNREVPSAKHGRAPLSETLRLSTELRRQSCVQRHLFAALGHPCSASAHPFFVCGAREPHVRWTPHSDLGRSVRQM